MYGLELRKSEKFTCFEEFPKPFLGNIDCFFIKHHKTGENRAEKEKRYSFPNDCGNECLPQDLSKV